MGIRLLNLSSLGVFLAILYQCKTPQNSVATMEDNWQIFNEYSGITEAESLIIKDEKTWKAWLQKTQNNQDLSSLSPSIDFSKNHIAVIAFGQFSQGGNTFKVVSYKEEGKQLHVVLSTPKASSNEMVTMALTQPILFFAIPHTQAQEIQYQIISE